MRQCWDCARSHTGPCASFTICSRCGQPQHVCLCDRPVQDVERWLCPSCGHGGSPETCWCNDPKPVRKK